MSDSAEPLLVLYDQDCGLCRRLAEYGHARSGDALHFDPWQDFVTTPAAEALFPSEEREGPPRHLRALRGNTVLQDQEAWEAILAAYPPFESLTWIAKRLGLLGAVSRVTYYGGTWARSACKSCP